MSSNITYSYRLQPYQGRATRHTCPACQKPACFTRYLNTATGEPLGDEYGRCDHELNCGYHRNPYHDKLLQQRPTPAHLTAQVPPSAWLASPKVHTIPPAVFQASVQPEHYQANALATFLRTHFGLGAANGLLQRFQVGTSTYWPGACVFWLLDERSRIRGGQVVLYDEAGHTIKLPFRHTRWVHTAMTQHYLRLGQPVPTWLVDYNTYGQKCPCLFGLPQLATVTTGKHVALVESAKTAMIATHYMPQFVWLATMGLGNLNGERLRPIKNRKIMLYPDAGAFDNWSQKAAGLRQLGYDITVSQQLEKVVTEAERQVGLDLADVLLREYQGYPPN